MSGLPKTLLIASSLLLLSGSPVLAQVIIPTPQSGLVQSDFAKDVSEGMQSIKNDNQGQNNQQQIDSNELDDGLQGDIEDGKVDEIKLDENLDQDEVQETLENGQQETPEPTVLETPEPTSTGTSGS